LILLPPSALLVAMLQSLGLFKSAGSSPTAAAAAAAAATAEQEQVHRPLGGIASRRCRRLRHISQLAVRGLGLSAGALEVGYVLELGAQGASEALERSDVFHTQNPTWEPVCGVTNGRGLSMFEFRAIASGSSRDILWQSVVKLPELECLNCQELEQVGGFPLHEVVPLVQLGKQWYTIPSALPSVVPAAEPPRMRPQVKQVSASEICGKGEHVSAMIARLQELRSRSQALRDSMDGPLVESRQLAAGRLRQSQCAHRNSDLREQVSKRKKSLERLRTHSSNRRQEVESRSAVGKEKLNGAAADAAPSQESQKDLHSLWMQLRCRQMRMLHEVSQVYPIENRGNFWAIRGLSIAAIETLKRQDLREEESVSTALGFLAHLLVTVASILEVPLRVRLREAGSSRSCIRDLHEVAVGVGGARARSTPREWPLYYGRSQERPRFETALRLMRDGLHQFLYSRGHLDNCKMPSGNLLECAELLLRRELFGPDNQAGF